MVRLEAFIDDKKVAKVLYALDRLVIQLTMTPVRNAVKKGDKVIEAGQPTTTRELLMGALSAALKNGQKTITRKEMLAIGETYGFSKAAIATSIMTLKTEHVIRKTKKVGQYSITEVK